MRIHFAIPGEPMGKQRPKFGKGFTYTPQKTVNYETLVKEMYLQKHFGKKLNGALSMTIWATFSIPKSASKAKCQQMIDHKIRPTKKPDCDNITKIICDALNKIAYDDDAQIVTVECNKYYGEQARVEVEIEEVTS
jgi:Holliday junction resolvase RusA-like endonuclease